MRKQVSCHEIISLNSHCSTLNHFASFNLGYRQVQSIQSLVRVCHAVAKFNCVTVPFHFLRLSGSRISCIQVCIMTGAGFMFGPWQCRWSEVFYLSKYSLAMVNLKPIVPGKAI